MPPKTTFEKGVPYDIVCKTANSIQLALEMDIAWLVSVMKTTDGENPNPEWSGAMVEAFREKGTTSGLASHLTFGPLIDMTPSHPDIILTRVNFVQEAINQQYIHLSADIQLFKAIMQIIWSDLKQ